MIRHSSSFFISLIIHTFLAIALFYTYKSVVYYEDTANTKVELKLCCMVEKKPELKPIEKPKEVLKQKPPQPKAKQIKRVEKKQVPMVKEEIKPEEPAVENAKAEVTEELTVAKTEVSITAEEKIVVEESSPEQDYMDEHIKQITKLLQENLYYPRSARKRGITGEIIVKFRLLKNASVESVEVISANSGILSRAAVQTIEDLSGKFPKPSEDLFLSVPINYNLNKH